MHYAHTNYGKLLDFRKRLIKSMLRKNPEHRPTVSKNRLTLCFNIFVNGNDNVCEMISFQRAIF